MPRITSQHGRPPRTLPPGPERTAREGAARAGAARAADAGAGRPPIPGVASLAIRGLLHGTPRRARVIAALPAVTYLEFAEPAVEPRVIALVAPGAIRLPNAIVLKPPAGDVAIREPAPADGSGPGTAAPPPAAALLRGDVVPMGSAATRRAGTGSARPGHGGDDAWAGNGRVTACGMEVQIRRWWDPCPVLRPLRRARLEHGVSALARVSASAAHRPGLEGHNAPAALAAYCAAGDLAGAVETAESLVGLGPGLMPSGDSMISGLLLALRLLGGATAGGTRAVWLADWLSAAVTCYAQQRTTPLAASLLHCAARGQAAEEVSAVLRSFAGQEPAEPAARRLLAAGQQAGADLAWGLVAGCRAALALSAA
jgi:hypothetical protein